MKQTTDTALRTVSVNDLARVTGGKKKSPARWEGTFEEYCEEFPIGCIKG